MKDESNERAKRASQTSEPNERAKRIGWVSLVVDVVIHL